MGAYAGPKTVTDGLVFALDARNTKTYGDIPDIMDHGISDWYCFTSGTATYSAIYPNTEIIEIDENGNEVGIVTTGSDPQRGTFTTTASRRYYGTKAVHLLQTTAADDQHELAPVSFAGTYFAHRWIRNSPTTYYAYAPQDDTTLEFFDNDAAGGVTGTVTATHNISKGFTTSFQSTAVNTWQFFKADKPIIMTAGGSGADKTILAPATQYNYKRRNANNVTINNTTPSGIGNYVTYDTSLPVATVEIGDGAGGDCTQGIGYEYLSDTYSWGDSLSDYRIVAPYSDTTVTVSYWANGIWNVGEVHSLSGTQTSPGAVFRDGNNGFGVSGTGISGGAAFLASGANLWKFEGTQPFALIINDISDDEERLLGWMSNKYLRTSSNVTQSFVNLIDKDDRSRMKIYGKDLTTTIEYAGAKLSASDYIEFDGVDDYINLGTSNTLNFTTQFSVSFWMNNTIGSTLEYYVNRWTYSIGDYRQWSFDNGGTANRINFRISSDGTDGGATGILSTNASYSIGWHNICGTWNGSVMSLYVDGVLVAGPTTKTSIVSTPGQSTFIGGGNLGSTLPMSGNLAQVSMYNRALTPQEIQQNFNATRGRFGV